MPREQRRARRQAEREASCTARADAGGMPSVAFCAEVGEADEVTVVISSLRAAALQGEHALRALIFGQKAILSEI